MGWAGPGYHRLTRLYPRHWRDRYQDEFDELVNELEPGLGRLGRIRLVADIIRGAVDAHLHGRFGMRRHLNNPPLRRGFLDGLVIAGVIAVVLFLSEVVYPKAPTESDDDPEYIRQLILAYALLVVLFIAIGVHARWRRGSAVAGLLGGVAAAVTVTVIVFMTTAFIDNTFLSIVSQQHDKRMAFQRSGFESMRLFLNLQNLMGLIVLLPVGAFIGGLLGGVGGVLAGPFARPRPAGPAGPAGPATGI